MKVCHIIVAAGSGTRFGGSLPKQFCDFDGRPLLMTTIERMRSYPADAQIMLVLSENMRDLWLEMCREHQFESPCIVNGGDSRWQSVKNALDSLHDSVDCITVHDGARPIIDADLIRRVVDAVEAGADGAIPAVALTESIRLIRGDGSTVAADRSKFLSVQTPQAFDAQKLIEAYRLPYQPTFTDDASVMEAAGFDRLAMVEGGTYNIKVTNPRDIEVALLYNNFIK